MSTQQPILEPKNDQGVPNKPGTPAAGGVAGVTPTQPSATDEAVKLQKELEKREQDLNRMKSTFQTQQHQLQQQWEQEKQDYERKLREIQMQGLPEGERAKFQQQIQQEEYERIRQQNEQLRRQQVEMAQAQQYAQFFQELGVAELVTDQGVEGIVNSGWSGTQKLITDLRNQIAELSGQTPAQQNPQQPAYQNPTPSNTNQPITTPPASYGLQPSWHDLIQRYGTEEEVYRMVESGQLPPSIIPMS